LARSNKPGNIPPGQEGLEFLRACSKGRKEIEPKSVNKTKGFKTFGKFLGKIGVNLGEKSLPTLLKP